MVLLEECQTVFCFFAGTCVRDKFEIIIRHLIDFRHPEYCPRLSSPGSQTFRDTWSSRKVHRTRVCRSETRQPHDRSIDVNNTTGTRLQ